MGEPFTPGSPPSVEREDSQFSSAPLPRRAASNARWTSEECKRRDRDIDALNWAISAVFVLLVSAIYRLCIAPIFKFLRIVPSPPPALPRHSLTGDSGSKNRRMNLSAFSRSASCERRSEDDYKAILRGVHQSQQKVTISNFFDPLQSQTMSKKQWLALLVLYVTYLFFGALVFFFLEKDQESIRQNRDRELYEELVAVLKQCGLSQNVTLDLESYCGKPLSEGADQSLISPVLWNFYNSVFFVITVVSTVGYGNIHPTTPLTRIIMIFYAIIGVPLNGILLTSLAQFFSTVFLRAHKKYKRYESRCGLAVDVLKYLIPGILFFIFVPATAFYYFEGWSYEESVYFAFVTLTTIGFGDMVAGQTPSPQINSELVSVYKILLLCWIIFGLGYLIMILGFITRAMRSKKMVQLEHKLVEALTHSKIWHGFSKDIGYLRRLMNELYLEKVKPVFFDESQEHKHIFQRSKSLPNLALDVDPEDFSQSVEVYRKRANSDYISCKAKASRACSETDLIRIDRSATFASVTKILPDELIHHVVSVAGGSPVRRNSQVEQLRGVEGFSDDEILRSEAWNERKDRSTVSLNYPFGSEEAMPTRRKRLRALSECPNEANGSTVNSYDNLEWTWSGTGSNKIFDLVNERHKRILKFQHNARSQRLKRLGLVKWPNPLHKRSQRSSDSVPGSNGSLGSNGGSKVDVSTDDECTEGRGDRHKARGSQDVKPLCYRTEGNYVTYTAGSGPQGIGLVHCKRGLSRPERSLLELYMGGDHVFSKERRDVSEGATLAEFLCVLSSLHRRIGTPEEAARETGNEPKEPTSPRIESLLGLFAPPESQPKQKSNEKIQEPSNLKRLGRFLLRSYSTTVKAEPSVDSPGPAKDQPQAGAQKTKRGSSRNLADGNYFTVTGNPFVSIRMDDAGSPNGNFCNFNVDDSIQSAAVGPGAGARGTTARARRGSTPAMTTHSGRYEGFRSRIGVSSESVFWDSRRYPPGRRRPWEPCSAKPGLSDVKEVIR